MNIYFESGIRNINDLAKKYREAEIYFHRDMDGVTSAIAIKQYLRSYNIIVTDVFPIEYGSMEYAIPTGKPGLLKVLVDFAHGKIMMNIHTDHHETQIGISKGQSTSFKKTPSNLEYISSSISPSQIFPSEDAKYISIIDSANFAKNEIMPDEVIQAIFTLDKAKSIELNKRQMAFVVNKLLLAFKSKKDYLKQIVMKSSPSIQSMFVTIISIIKERALLKDPKQQLKDILKVSQDIKNYEQSQADLKLGQQPLERVLTLAGESGKAGESMMLGNILVQYGSSPMFGDKQYDRYTAFKLNPEAEYFCMIWPLGLIQVSKNPFKKGVNPISLGDLILGKGKGTQRSGGIMDMFKEELQSMMVSLYSLKKNYEGDIDKFKKDVNELQEGKLLTYSDSIGFTADDFVALFKGCNIKGLSPNKEWKKIIRAITNKKIHNLVEVRKTGRGKSMKQQKQYMTIADVYPEATASTANGHDPKTTSAVTLLKEISVPLWDIIMVNSGGHKDITNVSGLNFYSYVDNRTKTVPEFLKSIAHKIVEKMKGMKLVDDVVESFEDFIK